MLNRSKLFYNSVMRYQVKIRQRELVNFQDFIITLYKIDS